MKATLILVGKTVDKRFAELISEYTNRLKHYISLEINTIPELKNTKSLTSEQQKNSEAELIIKNLQPSDYVVLLDEHGKEMRSIEMADWMKRKMNTINKRIVFIIGGPYGFSQKIYDIAHEKLSMSKMTFSHQMIRLIFVEQLYRSMTILNGEPYHHE
jgi:23S rRNA (pseudouridine1915-N3)-methyltransferase